MKAEKISEAGIVGQDGRVRMPMDRLNAFFAEHKGERVVVRFEAAAPGSTAAQRAYYYNYVVPTVTAAFIETGQRMTDDYTDRFLIQEYPGCKIDFASATGREITEARQMTQSQMSDFLDWLKQYAAENLSVYIEDPRTI